MNCLILYGDLFCLATEKFEGESCLQCTRTLLNMWWCTGLECIHAIYYFLCIIFRRGKPLYLDETRYRRLHYQWISHSFDKTCKKWILHREQL